MQIDHAIKAFSQSEKLKSGLIWATQITEMIVSLSENEKPGAEKALSSLISMIGNEIDIAKKASPHDIWLEAGKNVDTAMVMLNSGIAHESTYHLTQALSKVTTIGQQSMTVLVEEGLL
jgi:hypothetical protein